MQIISQSSPAQSKVRVSGALPHCSSHWRTWLIRSISWTGSWSGSGRSSPVALLSFCTPDRSHSGSPQSWTAELSTPVCLSSVLFRSWHTTDMSPLHLAVACKVDHLDFVADRKCKVCDHYYLPASFVCLLLGLESKRNILIFAITCQIFCLVQTWPDHERVVDLLRVLLCFMVRSKGRCHVHHPQNKKSQFDRQPHLDAASLWYY